MPIPVPNLDDTDFDVLWGVAPRAPAGVAAGPDHGDGEALCCELVDPEPAGAATGRPGLTVVARRPPIVAPGGDHLDLVVGVEALPQELGEHVPAVEHEGR